MNDLVATARGALFSFWCNRFRRRITIKPGLKLYKKVRIGGPGTIRIGSNCVIGGVIGDDNQFVCLDAIASDAQIDIGNDVQLLAARVAAKFEIVIGNGAVIEESAIMDTDFHSIARDRRDPLHETRENCKVSIGERVVMGARSIVLKGVTVGDDTVIMPGSIVVASVIPNSVICGNPARDIKKR